ncbi:M48 family metalloprotease [Streptomyces xinghaiensis]|uniref:M48 family metalloprotease n=1 Tax=Streptomyces xinghaiensis TaxID=1038928 RepID=UPI002E120F46|nr:M48 family metalloprotease [Streptomyces xinghaiensis]
MRDLLSIRAPRLIGVGAVAALCYMLCVFLGWLVGVAADMITDPEGPQSRCDAQATTFVPVIDSPADAERWLRITTDCAAPFSRIDGLEMFLGFTSWVALFVLYDWWGETGAARTRRRTGRLDERYPAEAEAIRRIGALNAVGEKSGRRRAVDVRYTIDTGVTLPAMSGRASTPVLCVPLSFLDEWKRDRAVFKGVIAHEYGHLARGELRTQRLARALYLCTLTTVALWCLPVLFLLSVRDPASSRDVFELVWRGITASLLAVLGYWSFVRSCEFRADLRAAASLGSRETVEKSVKWLQQQQRATDTGKGGRSLISALVRRPWNYHPFTGVRLHVLRAPERALRFGFYGAFLLGFAAATAIPALQQHLGQLAAGTWFGRNSAGVAAVLIGYPVGAALLRGIRTNVFLRNRGGDADLTFSSWTAAVGFGLCLALGLFTGAVLCWTTVAAGAALVESIVSALATLVVAIMLCLWYRVGAGLAFRRWSELVRRFGTEELAPAATAQLRVGRRSGAVLTALAFAFLYTLTSAIRTTRDPWSAAPTGMPLADRVQYPSEAEVLSAVVFQAPPAWLRVVAVVALALSLLLPYLRGAIPDRLPVFDAGSASGEGEAEECVRLGHDALQVLNSAVFAAHGRTVGTLDVLSAVLRVGKGDWTAFAVACGIGLPDPPRAVQEPEADSMLNDDPALAGVRITENLRTALEQAAHLTRERGEGLLSSVHLVLAMLDDETSEAAIWLAAQGDDASHWRRHIAERVLGEDPQELL